MEARFNRKATNVMKCPENHGSSKHYRWLVKQLEVLETGHELGI